MLSSPPIGAITTGAWSSVASALIAVAIVVACASEEDGAGQAPSTTQGEPDGAIGTGGTASSGAGGAAAPEADAASGAAGQPGPVRPGCNHAPGAWSVARVDRDTSCDANPSCNASEAQRLAGYRCTERVSDPMPGLSRTVGCGYLTVTADGGFVVTSTTFRDDTGAIVAARATSDVPYGPCDAYTYETGERPSCPDEIAFMCEPDPGVPPSLVGCRAPSEPGCRSCAMAYPASSTCEVLSSQDGCWCTRLERLVAACPGVEW